MNSLLMREHTKYMKVNICIEAYIFNIYNIIWTYLYIENSKNLFYKNCNCNYSSQIICKHGAGLNCP